MSKKTIFICFVLSIWGGFFASHGILAAPLLQMSVDELAEESRHGKDYKRILAIQTLAKKRSSEAVAVIIEKMLNDKSLPVRRAAQRALIGKQDDRIFNAILESLKSNERLKKMAAIDALSAVKNPVAFRLLADAALENKDDRKMVTLALASMRTVVYHTEPEPEMEKKLLPWLRSKDPKIKTTAIIIMGLVGRPAVLPDMIAIWDKSNVRTKIHLADAYANIGFREPLPKLLEALKSKNNTLVMHSLYALSQIQSYDALDAVWELAAKSTNNRILMACLYLMTEIPDERSIPHILNLMEFEDTTVLHWAAYALGQLRATDAEKKLLEKLDHKHSLVRATAAVSLGEIKAKASEERLLELLASGTETEEVKVAAVKSLMAIGSQKGSEYYWQALNNPRLDTSVHLVYATALSRADPGKYRQELFLRLDTGDFNSRFVSAVILGMQGQKEALPLLIESLDHGYTLIRRYSIIALEAIADEQAIRALAETANDDRDPIVKILCASSLMALGYPEYEILLWNALDDKNVDNRSEAIIALGRHMDETIYEKLKWYLRREPSVPVRQTIHRLFREWKSR